MAGVQSDVHPQEWFHTFILSSLQHSRNNPQNSLMFFFPFLVFTHLSDGKPYKTYKNHAEATSLQVVETCFYSGLWFTPVVLRSFWPSMIATHVAATKRSYDQLPPLLSGNLT